MKAVILCGGLASRLLPITKTIPKEMMPLINRPAIDYCIEDLKENSIKDVLIILGRNKEVIENYFDRNIELENRLKNEKKTNLIDSINKPFKNINVTFIRQIETKGTGYATLLARNFVGTDPFLLIYPDDIIINDSLCRQLIKTYNQTKKSVIPLKKINIQECYKYGMVSYKKENNLISIYDIIEKPDIFHTPSDICYTGGGIFTNEIFDHLEKCTPQKNGEILLTDAFKYLINAHQLNGVEINGTRLDLGTPIEFLKSNILMGINSKETKKELIDFIKNLNL